MSDLRIESGRLELVAATPELARADVGDRSRFAELLRARVPGDWPPELFDDDARAWLGRQLEERPESAGWWLWYLVRKGAPEERVVVGVCGYKGPPDEMGTVEVGYSVLAGERRRGYASEAVGALVDRAFADPAVTRVVAETYPELAPSIGVLEKQGFRFAGDGSEERVIRYELPRAAWAARRATGDGR